MWGGGEEWDGITGSKDWRKENAGKARKRSLLSCVQFVFEVILCFGQSLCDTHRFKLPLSDQQQITVDTGIPFIFARKT